MLKNNLEFSRRILLFSFCFFGLHSIFAQGPIADSNTDQLAVKNAIDIYYNFIGENNHLNNGSEYVTPFYRESMHPYYKTILFSPGSVVYDDISYSNIALMYDIINDQLITNRYKMNYRIVLVNDKIKSFSLLGHNFVRIVQDSNSKSGISTGYFDQLYSGNLKVFVKRQKKREEILRDNELIARIVENDIVYIQKGEIYLPIKNKKTLFSVFRDQKNDLRKYLRRNNINFKENPENAIVKSAEYIDQLKN
jgi:hypothetical protein